MKNKNSGDNSPKENRKHKDSLFSFLFSNPDILRELYSAIEGITLPPDIPIDINTLSGIIYKDKINDLSFTIDNRLVVLIEHQSTKNNNLPLRLLIYIAKVYEKIVNMKKAYQTKLEKIPYPEFIVLFNGKDKYPDYSELKISDAFKDIEGLKSTKNFPLELIVQVYNINQGHNQEILKKCKTLDNYSIFIDKIREYQKTGLTLEKSYKNAIEYCIENNILKKFLEDHSSEVFNMLLTEWNWDDALEVAREEGREDGLEEGIGKEKVIIAKNLLLEGSTPEFVHRITGLSLDEISEIDVS